MIASISPFPTWCSWSPWCTGTIWRDQCRAFPLLLPMVILQLWNVVCLHLSFLVFWKSHLCSTDLSLLGVIPSHLAPLLKNQFIPRCNISYIKIIFHLIRNICPFPRTCIHSPLILWGCQNVWILSQSLLCLLLNQRVIPWCGQHTTILCSACL